jgi:zinc transport system substrate-binding protein
MKMIIMTGRRLAHWAVCLVALLGAGCVTPAADSNDGRLDVVVSVYPFQFVAERIAGPRARVVNLTSPGVEPHDLELTPRQVGALTRADLIIYTSGFQPAVDEGVVQSENPYAFDTTTVVPLEAAASHGHEEHGAGEHGAEEHGHEKAGHSHGPLDPHVWLDPTKLATIAAATADRLAVSDPGNAESFRRNAFRLQQDLHRLDADLRSGLTGCLREEFITTHAAFGYLARRYGLTEIGITGINPGVEPSPARIAEIAAAAREHEVTTIFTETLASPALASAIAGDLGLKTAVLDPIEGITSASAGSDYFSVMEANLRALEEANGCPRI